MAHTVTPAGRAKLAWVPVRLVALVVAVAAALVAGCADDGGSEEAFCATARRFAEDNPATVFDRYDPADPAGSAALLRGEAARLREWAGQGPGAIDDDVDVIAEAAADLADAFEDPETADAGELAERFTEVEDASVRVVAYVRDRCGVDLDPASVTTASASSSTPTTASP
jgi:hypothetical protein